MSTNLLLGWGAYLRDKNTSARLCAKNAGGGASLVPRLSVGWEKEPGIYCSRMRVIIPC